MSLPDFAVGGFEGSLAGSFDCETSAHDLEMPPHVREGHGAKTSFRVKDILLYYPSSRRIMYNPDHNRTFYDAYGTLEWDRLGTTAYGRLQGIIHADFLRPFVRSEDRVLDAGRGRGRFSIVAAELGATVTTLDLSDRQLQIARKRIA